MKERILKMFGTVDEKDANEFISYLTDDISFTFANAPAAKGKEAVRQAVTGLFSAIKGLKHDIKDVWEKGDAVICEGTVTYTRLDGKKLSYPFANIMRAKDGLIYDYRIYIDSSTLFTATC